MAMELNFHKTYDELCFASIAHQARTNGSEESTGSKALTLTPKRKKII